MKKKKRSVLKIILLVFLAAFIAVGGVYCRFGGFSTGKTANVEEFAKYAKEMDAMQIPGGKKIVALGEASHGNAEFQQFKLDVFKNLVENNGVRAFALEGDFGGCEFVNRYIHGSDSTARKAAAAIGFAIYRTQQMEDLFTWMREYNEKAAPGEDLVFYGFDMQRYENNCKYLEETMHALNLDTSEIDKFWDGENLSSEISADEKLTALDSAKAELSALSSNSAVQAAHFCDIIMQNIELEKVADDYGAAIPLRDKYMAKNIMWILEQENKRGNECIFVSAHNGHIEKLGNYGDENSKEMGNLLSDALGDDYFAIGTDFYKTVCNLPKNNGRLTHTFYSHDPFAKAAKKAGFDICWLNFDEIDENSELKAQLCEYTWMGSLGESYNIIFNNLLPMTYRVWSSPAELYDAMIFVTEAHPTEIKEIEK